MAKHCPQLIFWLGFVEPERVIDGTSAQTGMGIQSHFEFIRDLWIKLFYQEHYPAAWSHISYKSREFKYGGSARLTNEAEYHKSRIQARLCCSIQGKDMLVLKNLLKQITTLQRGANGATATEAWLWLFRGRNNSGTRTFVCIFLILLFSFNWNIYFALSLH